MPPEVALQPVPPGAGLGWLAADWALVEAAGGARRHPGRTAAWTATWTATHAAGPLLGLRVGPAGAPLAVGLVEVRRGRRWSFAGRGVSTSRGLVCVPGAEARAWAALRATLREAAGRHTELEAEDEVPALLGPRPVVYAMPAYAMELPASLEELLARRSKNSRSQLRKKLRRFERAGGEVAEVAQADLRPALGRLVALHAARAASLGQVHAGVDGRLVELLAALHADPRAPEVRVFEARHQGRAVAVGARVDHGGTGWYLQIGVDPAHTGLSPGVCLSLHVIADACDRGLARFDLGPGEFRYKRDVGGQAREHLRVVTPSRSPAGLLLHTVRRAVRRAQASTGSRPGGARTDSSTA